MTCKQVKSLLMRLADGTLDMVRREQLEYHLAACAECLEALEAQTETRTVLSERPPSPVSLGFATRIMTNLETEPATGWAEWMDTLNWRRWTFRLAPVVGALILTAIFGISRSDSHEPAGAVDFSELATAWVASDSNAASGATLDTVTLIWMNDETDDILLDVLLTSGTLAAF